MGDIIRSLSGRDRAENLDDEDEEEFHDSFSPVEEHAAVGAAMMDTQPDRENVTENTVSVTADRSNNVDHLTKSEGPS